MDAGLTAPNAGGAEATKPTATETPSPAAPTTEAEVHQLLVEASRKRREARNSQRTGPNPGQPAAASTEDPAAAKPSRTSEDAALSQSSDNPLSPEADPASPSPEAESSGEDVPAADTGEDAAPEGEDAAPEGEGGGDEDEAEDRTHPDWKDKRLKRYARRQEELKGEIEALKAKVAQFENQPPPEPAEPQYVPAPTADNPLAHVMDEKALQAEVEKAWKIKHFAAKHPDGTDQFSAEDIRQAAFEAERTILQYAPAREQFIVQSRQSMAEAVRDVPVLKDANHPLTVQFRRMMATPAARSDPRAPYVLANALENVYRKQQEAQANAKPKPVAAKPKVAPAKVTARSTVASPSTTPLSSLEQELRQAQAAHEAQPTDKTLERVFALRSRLQRSRPAV